MPWKYDDADVTESKPRVPRGEGFEDGGDVFDVDFPNLRIPVGLAFFLAEKDGGGVAVAGGRIGEEKDSLCCK